MGPHYSNRSEDATVFEITRQSFDLENTASYQSDKLYHSPLIFQSPQTT